MVKREITLREVDALGLGIENLIDYSKNSSEPGEPASRQLLLDDGAKTVHCDAKTICRLRSNGVCKAVKYRCTTNLA